MFLYFIKTKILTHFKNNSLYILSKMVILDTLHFSIFTQREISQKFLIFILKKEYLKNFYFYQKQKSLKNNFIHIPRKSPVYGCQPKIISNSLFVKRFYFSINYSFFLFYLTSFGFLCLENFLHCSQSYCCFLIFCF